MGRNEYDYFGNSSDIRLLCVSGLEHWRLKLRTGDLHFNERNHDFAAERRRT